MKHRPDFRRNYSTVDNLFSLQAIIQKYLSKQGGRFYCLYVDFRKDFDKINHLKLFQCLKGHGIHGNFLKVLLSMYKNLSSCIKTVNGLTDFFECNTGTRQGDKSSSIIFNSFINQLCIALRKDCKNGIYINENIPDIICLMFADDIANCSDTFVNLQKQLNIIQEFCLDTGMEVNLDKTEINVFRNGGPLRLNEKWYFRNKQVSVTSCYKYMGLLFYPNVIMDFSPRKISITGQKINFFYL